jgi:hypothetical protein
MKRLFSIVFGIVISLDPFGTTFALSLPISSTLRMFMIGFKFGFTSSQAFSFSIGIWWAWRHQNLMCLQNETWSINRLSFNIQSMIATLISCFSSR